MSPKSKSKPKSGTPPVTTVSLSDASSTPTGGVTETEETVESFPGSSTVSEVPVLAPPIASPRTARPSKKSTVSELKEGLESLGLDSKGKKETLWKRLIAAFSRNLSLDSAHTEDQPHPIVEAVASSSRSTDVTPSPRSTRARGDDDGFTTVKPRRKAYVAADYESFLCFDVEATCEAGKNFEYPNEIIEFPVVLLRWVDEDRTSDPITVSPSGQDDSSSVTRDRQDIRTTRRRKLVKIDTFHSYVRPTWRPKLSDFCTSLTGITQEMVDACPTFPGVLTKLEKWLRKWDLLEGDRLKKALWVTDGPWDLRDFIPKQLFITPTSPPRYPAYLQGEYLNLKQAVQSVLSEQWRRNQISLQRAGKGPIISRNPDILSFDDPEEAKSSVKTSFRDFTAAEEKSEAENADDKTWGRLTTGRVLRRDAKASAGPNFYRTIDGQLEALGLGLFEGRQHSGLDDATNIARILIALSDMDVIIEANAKLPPPANSKKFTWMGTRPGEIIYDIPQAEINGSMPGRETKKAEGKVEENTAQGRSIDAASHQKAVTGEKEKEGIEGAQ